MAFYITKSTDFIVVEIKHSPSTLSHRNKSIQWNSIPNG